ncbi:MAG: UDP-N-acetylenolpyruvoylglucosamine reductase [Syntrophus sp. (in: bacteria)]|nr:UDP-N-acetylenolpyruvoylglucosamine reductase [Syntrophus sp. (in: bacteria)]
MDWSGIRGVIMKDVSMKRYTSMKVGGPARFLIYPLDEQDLVILLERLRDEGITARFLGNGTNIIVSDRGLNEALIRITRMRHTRYRKADKGIYAEVSGGASLTGFIRENGRRGFSGLEKLFWIPGTIGGAVKMNAGSFGAAISDPLEEVRIIDNKGHVASITKKNGGFSYRRSSIKATECVLSTAFLLKEKEKKEVLGDMEYVYSERKRRHPMEYPSSGSIFKAVGGEPAWRFIEKAGLKGIRVGNAAISEKHANFIINLGSASAADIKMLIEKIKKEVYETCGVSLEEEVEFWGFDA